MAAWRGQHEYENTSTRITRMKFPGNLLRISERRPRIGALRSRPMRPTPFSQGLPS